MLTWPSTPEYYLRPNTPFATDICAYGASGGRSCTRTILYPVPRAGQRPPREAGRFHLLVRRVPWGEVVGPPPAEPMPRAALLHRGVSWRYALWCGIALLLAVASALLRARLRRSIRAA